MINLKNRLAKLQAARSDSGRCRCNRNRQKTKVVLPDYDDDNVTLERMIAAAEREEVCEKCGTRVGILVVVVNWVDELSFCGHVKDRVLSS